MPGGPVRFVLDGGEMLTVPAADLEPIYELLWKIALKPGAISLAAVVRDVSRPSASHVAPVDLTAAQSAVLREAVALLAAER